MKKNKRFIWSENDVKIISIKEIEYYLSKLKSNEKD
jgi:hypothetical protein